jgi:hypothetical protein
LPEGTAIDLRASGVGIDEYFYVPGLRDNADRVMVLFAPEGRVARLWYNQKVTSTATDDIFDEPVSDNVFLLIGKRENVPVVAAATDRTLGTAQIPDEEREDVRNQINWLSGSSRWLVIGSQSGRIVTVENALVSVPMQGMQSAADKAEENRNMQILAAREFTREMSQLGGR